MTEQTAVDEKHPENRPSSWAKIGIFFTTLAIVIFVCGFGYGYFQLSKINVELAQMVTDLQSRINQTENQFAPLKKSVNDMQQTLQKSQDLSAQQEKIMADWKAAQQGDLEKWRVAEAQYLTRLADDHLQFGNNVKVAMVLLQQADKMLENVQDSNLIAIRQALATDLANLQALPQVDTTAVFLRLNALNDQIEKLPFPVNALKADQKTPAPIAKDLPWWKAGMEYTWQGINKIVIIRKNNTDALPLVMPEEKSFLYQNIHSQFENASWAVMHDNAEIYQASLTKAAAWINLYFDQNAQETKSMLQNLDELRKINLQTTVTSLSNTLQLFSQYLSQVG